MKLSYRFKRGMMMNKTISVRTLFPVIIFILLAGCAGSPGINPDATLSADNINLIFVVSPDLVYHSPGDIALDTANLTSQGLQRSLMMATYLKQHLLGTNNVTGIYVLEPMTHLQTANKYPDMAAIGFIAPFALLNQYTAGGTTANSYPLNAAYAPGAMPAGVATPSHYVPGRQGLDFSNMNGNNTVLINGIIKANKAGYYVFAAPWETVSALLLRINELRNYDLIIPETYRGSNPVYVIAITPSGNASLTTFNSNLNPPSTYPKLPPPQLQSASCPGQPGNTTTPPFSITVTGGTNGAVIPVGINTNETIYFVRHVEAHPGNFEDGNYVCAGQWRALYLPNALRGKISPDHVYSIDPAQSFLTTATTGFSYVRPSLTVAPYAVANNLPYKLAARFSLGAQNPPVPATEASAFFFNGGNFSNHKILLAWESQHIPTTVNALIASYFPGGVIPNGLTAPNWSVTEYDAIWTVTLDAMGNLTVDNAKCEGIDSASLPDTCPQF